MTDKEFENDIIKISAYYSCCLFPKAPLTVGSNGSTYGIVKWEVENIMEGEPSLTQGIYLVVKGDYGMKLEAGVPYIILAKEVESERYGKEYELLYINRSINLAKNNNVKAFLKTFLTDNQINELYKVYPTPIDVIKNHDVEGLKKVKGIGNYIANCIIDRYEQNKDMSRIFIELDSYGLTPNFIQKLTTTYRNPDKIIDVVKNHPYELCYKMEGVGFKTADAIALKGGLNPKSPERIKAYVFYYMGQEAYENGNSYITAAELITEIYSFFGGKEEIEEYCCSVENNYVGTNIGLAMKTLQQEGILVIEDGENKARRRVYLKKIYELEEEIAYHLKRLINAPNNFRYNDWKEQIKKLQQKQGFEFDEDQLAGIKKGLDNQVCLITGSAGTGKSSLVSGILASLHNYTFAQTALAGKAAARLQEVTGEEGKTIHRLLGYEMGNFTFNEENQLPYDIIILDEISLVGGEIFLDLLKAIRSGTKLIILGDDGQLPAIGLLNIVYDLKESPIIPNVNLTKIHRQASKSGIIGCSFEIRNQRPIFSRTQEGIEIKGELQDMYFDLSPYKEDTRERAIRWFNKAYESKLCGKDIMKIQMIAPIKERGDACIFNLNKDVQYIVNPLSHDEREYHLEMGFKDKKYSIYKNDKVICIKNCYDLLDIDDKPTQIFNGWTGLVSYIGEDFIEVDFPLASNVVVIPIKKAKEILNLGYAISVHKSQGSDYPIVIGVIDYSTPPKMLTNSLVYTLLTRAKKKCILIAQSPALDMATSTNFVPDKRTFLVELLNDGGNK